MFGRLEKRVTGIGYGVRSKGDCFKVEGGDRYIGRGDRYW